MSSKSHYAEATVDLRRDLARALPQGLLKDLHRASPAAHLAVYAWQILLLAAGATGAVVFQYWYAWLPCSIVMGFTIFNFTVMLHEVVHDAVFERKGTAANRLLGLAYAFPSGISRTQFTRWHLDHHAQLGDAAADPKRHHLSPRRNARWYKALYLTPVLFFIYFRAAARETATYPPDAQRIVKLERTVTILGQLAILATIGIAAGWWIAFKVYMVPYFFVFPVAFTLNRLGQHYNIDPSDPARWSSLVKASRFWDIAFLWSSYHLEHHYFPRVPFYRLRKLHMLLQPFFREHGLTPVTYRQLLWNWFVLNRRPHTNWAVPDGAPSAPGALGETAG